MKVARTRRATPPPDDDAVLDAAAEPARVEQAVSEAPDSVVASNGAAARVAGPPTAGPETEIAESATEQETVQDASAETIAPTAQVTTVVDVTAPAAYGSRGVLRRGLPSLEVDDRLGRLILALVLAILLWFYVANVENPAQTTSFRDLPVEVRGTAGNMKVISALPTVDVIVQAPQNLMSGLTSGDVRPFIDLSNMNEGVHEVPVDIETRSGSQGGLVVSANPRAIQVQLELQVTRAFSAVLQLEGAPPIGYQLGLAQVSPTNVQVTGSQEATGRIARIIVPVNVAGRTTDVQGTIEPLALDSAGREVNNITFQPSNLQVLVPITSYLTEKTVTVRASVLGQPAPGYSVRLSADPSTVILCCSSEAVASTEYVNVVPVPITGTTSTIITRTQIILPPGVDLVPGQSPEVTVTVRIDELQSTIDLPIVPTVQGAPNGFTAFVNPDFIDVTLQGSFNRLQTITPDNIRLVADVSGLGAGAHNVPLRTILPDGVTLQNISANEVTVTLVAPTPVPPTATAQPSPTATQQPTVAPTVTAGQVVPEATSTVAGVATATATRTAPATATGTATAVPPTATPIATATAGATATTVTEPPVAEDEAPPAASPTATVQP